MTENDAILAAEQHIRVAKRSAEHMEEPAGPELKKVDWGRRTAPPVDSGATAETAPPPLKELDFAALPPDQVRLIGEAVDAALAPESRQPIMLDVLEGGDSESIAFWPKSRALGVWLLQALALLKQQNIDVHCEFVAALTACLDELDCEAVFQGYCDNLVRCPADLGRFCGVLELDENDMEPSDEHFVTRASLDFALYHQQCYLVLASCTSSNEEDEDDEEEESEGEEVAVCDQ